MSKGVFNPQIKAHYEQTSGTVWAPELGVWVGKDGTVYKGCNPIPLQSLDQRQQTTAGRYALKAAVASGWKPPASANSMNGMNMTLAQPQSTATLPPTQAQRSAPTAITDPALQAQQKGAVDPASFAAVASMMGVK